MAADDTTPPDAPPSDTDPVSVAEADAAAKEPELPVTPEEVKETDEPAPADEPASTDGTPPLSEDLPIAPSSDSDGSGDDGSGAKEDPAVDQSAPATPLEPEEDPVSAGVDTGSDKPLDTTEPSSTAGTDGATGASAPAVEPSAPETATSATEGTSGTSGTSESSTPPAPAESDVYEGLHSVAKPLADALGSDVTEAIRKAGNALFAAKEKLDATDLEEVVGDAYWILSNYRNQTVGVLAAVESIFKRTR